MTGRAVLRCVLALFVLFVAACGTHEAATGRPAENSEVLRPDALMNFNVLYARNCSGCHGVEGKGGAATGIGQAVYLAIADDATITRVTADGVPGTSMPAFAQQSGGMLTDAQIHEIVHGIRTRWAKPDALHGVAVPPYTAQAPGDPKRGAGVYGTYCSSCHGTDGRGGKRASSIVDGSYLTLVSDQNLRTTVIAGRPEWGAPDWRGNLPGKPMSPEDVSDVVAWLASQRPHLPGHTDSSLQAEGAMR